MKRKRRVQRNVKETFRGVTEQAKASKHRLEDARVLLTANRNRGAMYLAGYAIECVLKAKLMLSYDCKTLTELEGKLKARGVLAADSTVFSHQLEALLKLTHALDRLRQNAALWRSFSIANGWLPAWRYSTEGASDEYAANFIECVTVIVQWIENNV